MHPRELLDLCTASVERWKADGGGEPPASVLLVVPRSRCPAGRTIALYGRSGPRGRIATIRENATGYDVVAYFPAMAIIDEISRAVRDHGRSIGGED